MINFLGFIKENFKPKRKNEDLDHISKLSDSEKLDFVKNELDDILNNYPPTIGVIGVSGTGKSSTLNSMFGTNLKVSSSVRGTTNITTVNVDLNAQRGIAEARQIKLRIVDAPGLGEDIRVDNKYLKMYKSSLPECDTILWIMTARNRATALDQIYLKELKEFWPKIVFGINQIDLVDPVDWSSEYNLPSKEQEKNLEEIIKDRSKRLKYIIGEEPLIVNYSATKFYNIIELFEMATWRVSEERRWLFEAIRKVSADNWLDLATGLSDSEKEAIRKRMSHTISEKSTRWRPRRR